MGRRDGVSWGMALAIAAVVLALDQATKAWVLQNLPGAPPLTVIPGFFDLTFSRNTGGVFGLLAGAPRSAGAPSSSARPRSPSA